MSEVARPGAGAWLPHGLALPLALLLVAIAGPLMAAPRVGLLTMDPGEQYWARYGHNALLVVEGEQATSYNFGYFDFDQPGFLARFLRGDMRYQLVALPYQTDIAGYAHEGRGVRVQWLALDSGQSQRLAAALAENALPENAEYRYDYFLDNCSTRVRDALDRALDGKLKPRMVGSSHGLSWRDEALRLASPLPWMAIGIHLGLGPDTDQPMNRWQEAYVPARLADSMRRIEIDGRPLVLAEAELLPAQLPPSPEAPPRWLPGFVFAGLLLLGLLSLLRRPTGSALQRLGVASAATLWLLGGLIGLGMLALWLFTDHRAAWSNYNLLLCNPLSLLLLAAVPALWRGRPPSRLSVGVGLLIAALALLLTLHSWLSVDGQRIIEWVALLLPAHLLLAHILVRSSRRSSEVQAAEMLR